MGWLSRMLNSATTGEYINKENRMISDKKRLIQIWYDDGGVPTSLTSGSVRIFDSNSVGGKNVDISTSFTISHIGNGVWELENISHVNENDIYYIEYSLDNSTWNPIIGWDPGYWNMDPLDKGTRTKLEVIAGMYIPVDGASASSLAVYRDLHGFGVTIGLPGGISYVHGWDVFYETAAPDGTLNAPSVTTSRHYRGYGEQITVPLSPDEDGNLLSVNVRPVDIAMNTGNLMANATTLDETVQMMTVLAIANTLLSLNIDSTIAGIMISNPAAMATIGANISDPPTE